MMSVQRFEAISRKLKGRGVRLFNIYNETINILCVCGKVKSGNLNAVLKAKRCTFCNSRRSEALTRKIYEETTSKEFKNCRPYWLKGLELDGYNEELKLAFEYNGIQHYKFMPKFYHRKGIKTFMEQLHRDELKKEICKERGIELHIIPYTFNYRNEEKLRKLVLSKINM